LKARSALGPRLLKLLELCLPDQPVWDLFCDHGYLGEAAYQKECFTEIHFVDQVPSIIKSLKARLHDEIYPPNIEVTYSAVDAHALDWSKVYGNIVFAGVGGELISSVLQNMNRSNTPRRPRRFILCPNSHFEKLKHNVLSLGLGARGTEEFSVDERGRERKILVFDER
jgi:tRNA A22 N-methylase